MGNQLNVTLCAFCPAPVPNLHGQWDNGKLVPLCGDPMCDVKFRRGDHRRIVAPLTVKSFHLSERAKRQRRAKLSGRFASKPRTGR